MKNLFKRSLAVALALIMSVSMLNLTAFADTIHCTDGGNHYGNGTTWTEKNKTYSYCIKCHTKIVFNGKSGQDKQGWHGTGEACPHANWSKWTSIKDPTCIQDGSQTRTCTDCQYTDTQVIPAKGHQWSGTTDNCTTHTDANCTGHSHICTATWHDETVDGKKTVSESHTFGDWMLQRYTAWGAYETETLADGTQVSVRYCQAIVKRTCSVCGHYEEASVSYNDTDLKGVEKENLKEVEGAKSFTVYHFEQGTEISVADPDTASFLKTDTSSRTFGVKAVSGYTPVDAKQSYTVSYSADVSESRIIYYTRTPEPKVTHTLTINYEYEDGTTAAPTRSEELPEGDDYNVDSPVIEGYTPDQSVVKGTMGSEDVTITVIYTANAVNTDPVTTYTLTVNHVYYDANGNLDAARGSSTTTEGYAEGASYTTSQNPAAGYTVTVSGTPNGVFPAGNVTVTYTYRSNAPVPTIPPVVEPTPTPTPTPTPEPSEEPVEIEDPETPLGPLPELPNEPEQPEEPIEVDEPETPLGPLPELPSEVEVEDPDVPLAAVPQTGDNTMLWATTAVASGAGLIWLAVGGKKKEQED